MVKAVLLTILAAALFACAVVFETAMQTQAAVEVAAAAQRTSSSQLQQRILSSAATRLQSSWARPALWNADAAEALSALYALHGNAVGGDAALYTESMRWAAQATQLEPAQPRSWARLAELSLMNLPASPCTTGQCLARSWAAAPLVDAEFDCARLRIAHRGGALEPMSERVIWYLQSGVGSDDAAACLSFLPRAEALQLMLRARSGRT
jgi:hypothetical protein